MELDTILIINDNADDIVRLQARLPEHLTVQGQSQAQARWRAANTTADLIVLDNDANETQPSKGAETLEQLRNAGIDTPVIYTSFQPGMVPASVHQTRNVRVIRTDTAADTIATEHGLILRAAPEQREPGDTSIIVTYNNVYDYTPGVYQEGQLLIVSYDRGSAGSRAPRIVLEHLQQLYDNFDWRQDRDLLRNIFVYDGVNGGEFPGTLAATLGHDTRMQVHMMACSCDWQRKERFRNSMLVTLNEVECGGARSLSSIADIILGIRRPDVNYDALPMTPEEILAPAERYT